jgi:prepilin-type N-terminal cleavage/methylation domain-containing protein
MKSGVSKGFTLLELIIVIIIVGVLAAIALPRMSRTVEYSRATEALQNLSSIRQSVERCYAMTRDFGNCNSFGLLDTGDPSNDPNSHFNYSLPSPFSGSTFTIQATRNTFEGNNAGDWIRLQVSGDTITRSGSGAFAGLQ